MIHHIIRLLKPMVERLPKVAAIYRGARDQVALLQPSVATPWGFTLAGNPEMASGRFEPLETELVRTLMADGDVLVNAGANIGYYCCHALSLGKSVIAFEPMHRNLQFLCRNIRENGWGDVEIHPIALSNRVDVIEIYGVDTGASVVKGWAGIDEGFSSLVPTLTIDRVIGGRLRGRRVLVVVDVEGAESWLLEGASRLLSNSPKPTWLVEITASDHQPSGVRLNPYLAKTFEHFFAAGYCAYSVENPSVPLSEEDISFIASGEHKPLSHNFLFRPTEEIA